MTPSELSKSKRWGKPAIETYVHSYSLGTPPSTLDELERSIAANRDSVHAEHPGTAGRTLRGPLLRKLARWEAEHRQRLADEQP